MKRILIVATILLTLTNWSYAQTAPPYGQGDWLPLGGEYYQGSNFVWRAHYDYCCGWTYTKLYPVTRLPAKTDPDFWTKMAELNVAADAEAARADYVKSRWPGTAATADYATTGFSILQQGYAPQLVRSGTTILSSGPSYADIDVNGLIQEAQRLADRTLGVSQAATDGANGLVARAVEGNSAAAKIRAAGEVAASAIAATQPPSTKVEVWQKGGAQTQMKAATGSANAVAMLSHGLLMQNCSKCHNAQKQSGGLDLTVDPSLLADSRDGLEKKMRSGKMPKGGQRLEDAVIDGILAGIPKQSSEPPQVLPPDTPPPAPGP